MNHISLQTQNCIVTGEPASIYTGHVVAADCRGNVLRIIAGFKDNDALRSLESRDGCFGNWELAMGLQMDPTLSGGVYPYATRNTAIVP